MVQSPSGKPLRQQLQVISRITAIGSSIYIAYYQGV